MGNHDPPADEPNPRSMESRLRLGNCVARMLAQGGVQAAGRDILPQTSIEWVPLQNQAISGSSRPRYFTVGKS